MLSFTDQPIIIDQPVVVVDAGGTVFYNYSQQTGFGQPFEKAFSTIKSWIRKLGQDRVFMVTRRKNQDHENNFFWHINYFDFCGLTGMPLNNIYVCRAAEEKLPIFRELNATHLVTDRGRDLNGLPDTIKIRILHRPTELPEKIDTPTGARLIIASNWQTISERVTPTLRAYHKTRQERIEIDTSVEAL